MADLHVDIALPSYLASPIEPIYRKRECLMFRNFDAQCLLLDRLPGSA